MPEITKIADSERGVKLRKKATNGYDFIEGKLFYGLDHEKRMEFGRHYAKKLQETHGKNLLFFGISGSTATNQNRLDSDIDGLVITRTRENWPESKWLHEMYNGIVVSIAFYTLDEIGDIIRNPDAKWPYRVKRIITSRPFYQEFDLKEMWQKLLESGIDEGLIRSAVAKQIIIAFSSLGKIIQHANEGDLASTRSAATETFAEYLDATVALLNREPLEDGYGFRNTFIIDKLKDKPVDYVKLSTILWESSDPIKIKDAAVLLLRNTAEFAKRFGIEIRNHTSIESLDVK
jgi:hypothetical protein